MVEVNASLLFITQILSSARDTNADNNYAIPSTRSAY